MTKITIECDGCGHQEQVSQSFWDGDEINDHHCDCGKFMGWMIVGGQAHTDKHTKGIDPVSTLRALIIKRISN